jgi:hypothetical protein
MVNMKILPLIGTTLKGFIRNWKSIVLLIVFPMLLISSFFISFHPNGMSTIPSGFVNEVDLLDISEFETYFSDFMALTEYDDLESCITDLQEYKQYTCLEIYQDKTITLKIHYDNTRQPIIWAIVQRIKDAVTFLQKEKAKEFAQGVLSEFEDSSDKSAVVLKELRVLEQDIREAEEILVVLSETTENSVKDINNQLFVLKQEIDFTRNDVAAMEEEASRFAGNVYDGSNEIEDTLDALDVFEGQGYLEEIIYGWTEDMGEDSEIIKGTIQDHAGDSYSSFDTMDYVESSIDNQVTVLFGVSDSLNSVTSNFNGMTDSVAFLRRSVEDVSDELENIEQLDPEFLVNPIVIRDTQTYFPDITIPEQETEDDVIKEAVRGMNLISLQTLFPSLFILIITFLSILIGSFVNLNEINSTAHTRIQMIRGIFFSHFIAIYLSSFIIIAIPISLVLVVGQLLFLLPILAHIGLVLLIIFLLISIFVFFSHALGHLLKKESITLVVSTFVLLFIIFLSGLILPVEQMSDSVRFFAEASPGYIAKEAFTRVMFYNASFWNILIELQTLGIWFVSCLAAAILLKKLGKG